MNKKNQFDPFQDLFLDKEEQLIERDLQSGGYVESTAVENTRAMLEEAAENYSQLQKSKPVTIRINQLDLIKVKAKAKRKNIPYQTLLSSLIHDFAEN